MSTGNHKLQPQEPAPQRDRRIMRRTRGQARGARSGMGGGMKERKKLHKKFKGEVGKGGELGGRGKKRR